MKYSTSLVKPIILNYASVNSLKLKIDIHFEFDQGCDTILALWGLSASYSSWVSIIQDGHSDDFRLKIGVFLKGPEASILGPVLFFICLLLLEDVVFLSQWTIGGVYDIEMQMTYSYRLHYNQPNYYFYHHHYYYWFFIVIAAAVLLLLQRSNIH